MRISINFYLKINLAKLIGLVNLSIFFQYIYYSKSNDKACCFLKLYIIIFSATELIYYTEREVYNIFALYTHQSPYISLLSIINLKTSLKQKLQV